MNIGQVARNQQMLYSIMAKNVSNGDSSKPAASSGLPSYSGLFGGWASGAEDDGDNFFSTPAALQGSVRQIAQRLYDASFSPDAVAGTGGSGSAQGIDVSGGDPAMQALRKHLAGKIESQQKLYQPDKTALSGNFEQLQTLAEECVSRLQTVSLSDETTKRIQELALTDARNSAGAQGDGEADTPILSQADRLDMIQEEIQKFAPSKRAAAFNTMNRVWQDELDRIGAHIKEKDPDWTAWGDKFDVGILDDYKAGVNVWA